MKTIFTILISITLAVNISIAQVTPNLFNTEEEQVLYLYELINEYRESKGLDTLILDTAIVNACEFHSVYMSFYDIGGHMETRRDSVHVQATIVNPWDRAERFGVILGSHTAENSLNLYYDNRRAGSKEWMASVKANNPNYKHAAEYVIDSWKNSEGHNKTLLMEDGVSCGVYTRVYVNEQGKTRISSTFFINSYYEADPWGKSKN